MEVACSRHQISHQQPRPLAEAESLWAQISTFFQNILQGADAELIFMSAHHITLPMI